MTLTWLDWLLMLVYFAFISANLGAQEIIGMAASGAKYGISTCRPGRHGS